MTAPAYRIEITYDPHSPDKPWDWRVHEVIGDRFVASGYWQRTREDAVAAARMAIVRQREAPQWDETLYATEAGEIIDAPVAT